MNFPVRVPQLNTSDPQGLARDLGRAQADIDERARRLPFAFLERWKRRAQSVTASVVRPVLRFDELAVVNSKAAAVSLYLPRARPSDQGRRCMFVKQWAASIVEVIPTDGSAINSFERWSGLTQVGLYEIWWDGAAWWIKEPAAKVLGHPSIPGTVGNWALSSRSLVDSSGNGYTLTVETGTERYSYISGTLGGFYFDGSTALWYNVAEAALRRTGDLTAEWLWIEEARVNSAYWFSHTATGELEVQNQLYGLSYTAAAPALSWIQESGAGVNSTYTGANSFMALGQLVHIAVTRISNVISVYLNGRIWGSPSAALTTPTGGADGRLRLGANDAARARGVMTSFRFLNYGRSAAEIMADRNYTLGGVQGYIIDV